MSFIVLSERLASKQRYFRLIAIICLTYLVIQWFYIAFAIFTLDDFWLAYHANHYKTGLPYRDFAPYKSVLGYYVFLVPLSLFHGVLSPLVYTKAWIALLNTVFLCGISLWLKKFFSAKAILTTLVLIISTPLFLLFSSEIRVDLLAYWLCLICVLFLFEKNYFLAGVSIGLGFLISQKVVLYFIATNCGLIGCWLVNERTWSMVKHIFSFNAGTLLMLCLYITFWSYYSSVHTVLWSLFYEPYLLYVVDWYVQLRGLFWRFIIYNSIELVLLWPLALIGLIILPAKNRTFILIYSVVILFFMVTTKQPFGYFPLMAVPALFVLFSSFFSALDSHIYASMHMGKGSKTLYNWVVFSTLLLIVIWPLSRFISNLPGYDGRYQKSMIHLMAQLLSDGGSYIAGVPLLLDIEQPIPGLIHLVGPAIDYMSHPSKELHSVLSLRSMYLTPVTAPGLIDAIQSAPIKLYVDNNRFHFTPNELRRYLDTQYQHFWGSIYLYAPQVPAGHQKIKIKFSGNYQVNANAVVSIDNKNVAPQTIIHLAHRDYVSDARISYRLTLVPDHVQHFLEPRYKENHWNVLLP